MHHEIGSISTTLKQEKNKFKIPYVCCIKYNFILFSTNFFCFQTGVKEIPKIPSRQHKNANYEIAILKKNNERPSDRTMGRIVIQRHDSMTTKYRIKRHDKFNKKRSESIVQDDDEDINYDDYNDSDVKNVFSADPAAQFNQVRHEYVLRTEKKPEEHHVLPKQQGFQGADLQGKLRIIR